MTAEDQVDRHNPETFAGWLRMRGDENRRVAELAPEEWPRNPHLLRHLAFRFDQGAALFDQLRNEVEQLRKDLAIQAKNAADFERLQSALEIAAHDPGVPFRVRSVCQMALRPRDDVGEKP